MDNWQISSGYFLYFMLCAAALAFVALVTVLFIHRRNLAHAEQLRTLLEGVDGFVYRCRNNKDWSLVFMAGHVYELTGYRRADFRNPDYISLGKLLHPEDRDAIWREVQTALAEKRRYDLSFRMITKDGNIIWVQERGSGVYDKRGELVCLQGHVFDADALTRSQHRLERAEAQARLGNWEFDPALGTGFWSPQMFRLFGRDPALGPPSVEAYLASVHPDDRNKVQDAMQAMFRGDSPQVHVFRTNPDLGEVHYLLPSWNCMRNSSGRPVRFSGTLLDVTEQQRTFEELRTAQTRQHELLQLARQEQGRMAALLSAMSIGILFEDRAGLIEYVNPAFRRMWAVSEELPLVGQATRQVMDHSTHRFARPSHASKHVLHVLDTHEISERFEVDLYDGRILTQLSYPVSDNDGRLLGRLWIYEDVTHERQTAQQLVYLAEHDPLTGLHNRHRFQEHLEWMILASRRNNTRFALLYFDLDDFKYINDTFGHRAGDTVLVRAAGEISSLVRDGEMFARLGGDEFAILTELLPVDSPIPLAERVRHAIAGLPFRFRGSNLRLTTSIGITIFPEHGDNAEDLIAHADSAMYQAKNAGKNNWSIYDASRDLSENMIARMNWVSRIAHAMEQNLLELHFQGVHYTRDRSLSHLEALVRMRDPLHPEQLIMPGQFIPIAEKSGQILEIDRWVLKQSIITLAQHPGLRAMSVNISGRSFDEPTLPKIIHGLLLEHGVDPERLIIELTETAAVSEMQDAQRFIEALQQTGCTVCLDDFGTGFSTFAYLKYLGVEVLKIDGMFIRDLPNHPENQTFVKAMIDVGRGLNKRTVAEFVEDEATFVMLRELGVDLVQGYHLDRPCANHPALTAGSVVNDPAAELQMRFLQASPGDVITLPAGTFDFERSLTLNVDNITLRGAGMDETVLSFRNQISGGEGLLVNASHFTIEDIGIEDSRGDALKIARGDHIVIRRVRTEWTNGPDTSNGAYGIYPVQTEHTLIEDSVAIAASDAGIYVGQSSNVIVRRNRAEFNVAGIEIENTIGADVYDNVAINNTGGILIFNMPNLPVEGHTTRVYNNRVEQNNTSNFAPPGTAVASVPAGSGIIINSNDKVEIFNNDLSDNQTANILISSYFSAGYSEREMAEAFDPYPETIFIYDNRFSGGGNAPDRPELDMLRQALFGADGRFPDVIWDGVTHPERSSMDFAICVNNGDTELLNIDAANNNSNPRVDMSMHQCEHPRLAAVALPDGMLVD